MKIKAVKCKNCGVIIYSRAHYDFHRCSCKKVAIDGGQDRYRRILGEPEDYETLEIEIDTSKNDMYIDWDTGADKLGVIKSK